MLKSNNNDKNAKVIMPHAVHHIAEATEYAIYHCFIAHVRQVPSSRTEIKVLSAIQFTADTLNLSDAHVSKALVEMGLRAPRLAFPLEFLDFADAALMRYGWEVGAPNEALVSLRDHWFHQGEKPTTASFRHIHSILREDIIHA
jgi:hypothetical protein